MPTYVRNITVYNTKFRDFKQHNVHDDSGGFTVPLKHHNSSLRLITNMVTYS